MSKTTLNKATRIGFVSLGCPKNYVDSEVMLGRLEAEGHVVTDDLANADTVIVNTCGFIEEAKQESIDIQGTGAQVLQLPLFFLPTSITPEHDVFTRRRSVRPTVKTVLHDHTVYVDVCE